MSITSEFLTNKVNCHNERLSIYYNDNVSIKICMDFLKERRTKKEAFIILIYPFITMEND